MADRLKKGDRVRIRKEFQGWYSSDAGEGRVTRSTSLGIAVQVRFQNRRKGKSGWPPYWIDMNHLEKL